MAYDKLVDSAKLDGALKSTADAIRAKTGGILNIPWDETEGFKSAVEGISAGGSGGSGGPLQAKTAWPSHGEQVIAPDEDYYGLVSVKVMPVPRLPVNEVSVREGAHGVFKVEQYLVAETQVVYATPATHAFYNGVRLPIIPENVLAQYPYRAIRKSSSKTTLICSINGFYFTNNAIYDKNSVMLKVYYLDGETWIEDSESGQYSGWMVVANGENQLFWASHDILNGSATATDIYFAGNEPILDE